MNLPEIAEISHDALRTYDRITCLSPPPPWSELTLAEQSEVQERIKKITETVKGNDIGGAAILAHNLDMTRRLRSGWRFGERYSDEEKTSPRLLPFEELSRTEQVRWFAWCGLISALQLAR